MESCSNEEKIKLESFGIKVFSFKEVEKIGQEYKKDHVKPSGDDWATICYTSGTTVR